MARALGLLLLSAGLLLCTGPGRASSFRGPWGEYVRVQARATLVLDKKTPVPGERGMLTPLGDHLKFRAGQRACVILMGDHDPIVPMVIEIRDEAGKVVARDEPGKGVEKADEKGNDLCAVAWYPPRDGYYSITIKNSGKQYNKCWLAIN
jgi:hypothetical protein